MKKITALILAFVLCFALFGCGAANGTEENENVYNLGDTVSTDIVEFTLNRAQLAIALCNSGSTNNYDNYGTPKEYSSAEDQSNPFVAATGHTYVFFSYSMTNKDRNSLEIGGLGNSSSWISVTYKDTEWVSNNDNLEFTTSLDAEDVHWQPNGSVNSIISVGETEARRGYMDIEVEAESLDDEFYITFMLPNSAGEFESFTYDVTAEALAEAIEAENAELASRAAAENAGVEERKQPADDTTVQTVRSILNGGSFEYTDYTSSGTVYSYWEFTDSTAKLTTKNQIGTLVFEGTYTVCSNDLFIDFPDEDGLSHVDGFIPMYFEKQQRLLRLHIPFYTIPP